MAHETALMAHETAPEFPRGEEALHEYAEIRVAEYYFHWYLLGCLVVSVLLVIIWNLLGKLRDWLRGLFRDGRE